MPFRVVLQQRTALDLQEAINYYDSQQINLVLKFTDDLEKHLNYIYLNLFFAITYNYRALVIKRFSYY